LLSVIKKLISVPLHCKTASLKQTSHNLATLDCGLAVRGKPCAVPPPLPLPAPAAGLRVLFVRARCLSPCPLPDPRLACLST